LFNSLEAAAHELDIVRSTEESKSAPENSEGGRGKESSEEQVARLGEAEWFKQEAEWLSRLIRNSSSSKAAL
jgi:hypothetical protein